MKQTLSIISAILITICTVAQQKTVRGPYETNRFFDNIFIQAGAGASVYLGGQNGSSFTNRIRPTFDVAVGKWITPSIGVRLQANYTPSMREYSSVYTSPFSKGIVQKFDFFNIHADFMWNLSAAIGGYKENRVYEVVPYIGFGWGGLSNYTNVKSNEITANFGIVNKFRISPTVDLNLELRSTYANGRFDKSTIANHVDIPVAATIGATFRLGKVKGFKRVAPPTPIADYTPYNTRIKELEKNLAAADKQAKELAEELEAQRTKVVAPLTVSTSDIVSSPVALFFTKGSSTLDLKELTNLDFYVKNTIKANPKKMFTIIGSADKATGTAAINQRLSEERMQYVFNLLVTKYGISADKLIKKAEGDKQNRFDQAELNRAVIIE